MEIDTYFGFFSQSVFVAIASSLQSQTGRAVALEELSLHTTNSIKLRQGDVETVILPSFAEAASANFLLALSANDTAGLKALGRVGLPLHRMMEQAVSAAMEPFNFISKVRNRLTGLRFSRNVTGLAARHLGGEISFTVALGRFSAEGSRGFSLRLLVAPFGRDLIEERAAQPHTQRALFSINEGAYICRPQWEPPPRPPRTERGRELSAELMNNWLNAFFMLNGGAMPPKVFRQPAFLSSVLLPNEALSELEIEGEGITVVRLLLNGEKELETIVILPARAEQSLMSLSKSGDKKFLGDFFRVLFGEAAGLWERFAGEPVGWRVRGVGRIPSDGRQMIASRLRGGGLLVRQEVRLDEGKVSWLAAIAPHTLGRMLRVTARAVLIEAGDSPERKAIFETAGWGRSEPNWPLLIEYATSRDLRDMAGLLGRAGLAEPHLALIAAELEDKAREKWLAALPVMLRERTEALDPAEGEAEGPRLALTETMLGLSRAKKLPPGGVADWMALFAEFHFARRQRLIDRLLPPRHLFYGMDRGSLSRLLFEEKNQLLADLLCGSEFAVVDQARRAISPGYALRLLEDVSVNRPRTTAYACQEALLVLYRRCHEGSAEGRYMLRETPAKRLGELIRLLDEPG